MLSVLQEPERTPERQAIDELIRLKDARALRFLKLSIKNCIDPLIYRSKVCRRIGGHEQSRTKITGNPPQLSPDRQIFFSLTVVIKKGHELF